MMERTHYVCLHPLCDICGLEAPMHELVPPLGSRDAASPVKVCDLCFDILFRRLDSVVKLKNVMRLL